MKKSLLNYCGLLGIVAFLFYTAAVVFSPMAYPGYDWMAQAVSDLSAANGPSLSLKPKHLYSDRSDLSAANAPSLSLWNQLSSS